MRIAIHRLGLLWRAPLFRGGLSLGAIAALLEIASNWAGVIQWAGEHMSGAIAFASSPLFGWFVLLVVVGMMALGIRQAGFMIADAESKRAAELRNVEKLIIDATLLPALMAQKPGLEERVLWLNRIIDSASERVGVATRFANPDMVVQRARIPPLLTREARFDLEQECRRRAPDFLEAIPELPVLQTQIDRRGPEPIIRPEDNEVLFGQIRTYIAEFEVWLTLLRRHRDSFKERLHDLDAKIMAEVRRLNEQQ